MVDPSKILLSEPSGTTNVLIYFSWIRMENSVSERGYSGNGYGQWNVCHYCAHVSKAGVK